MKTKSFPVVWVVLAAAVLISFGATGEAFAQRFRPAPMRPAPMQMTGSGPAFMRIPVNGRTFFFRDGNFYSRWRRGYFPYRPPIGARLPYLPYGLWSFCIGPAWYYYGSGIYYQFIPGENVYMVVPRPMNAPPPPAGNEDVMYLTNGSSMAGVFVGASADSIRFQVKNEVRIFPITQIKSITFAPSSFKEKK